MENFPFWLSEIWGPILNTKLHHIAEIYKTPPAYPGFVIEW